MASGRSARPAVAEGPGGDGGAHGSDRRRRMTVGLPPEALAPHAVSRWAASAPESVAIAHVGGSAITYGALDHACRQWAAAFRHLGVEAGSVVATMLPNGPTAFEVWLGLGWLRAIEAALNPALKGRFLVGALDGSGATILVTVSGLLDVVADVMADLPELRRVVVVASADGGGEARGDAIQPTLAQRVLEEAGIEVIDGATALLSAAPAEDMDGPSYRDVATLLSTSGTTGPSKGVLVTWASVYQTWSWVPADALTQGDGLYCPFPMFHTSGKSALNATLVRGARFVWRDRFSAADLWADIRRTDCVAACLVGPMLAYVHSQPAHPSDARQPAPIDHVRTDDPRDRGVRAPVRRPGRHLLLHDRNRHAPRHRLGPRAARDLWTPPPGLPVDRGTGGERGRRARRAPDRWASSSCARQSHGPSPLATTGCPGTRPRLGGTAGSIPAMHSVATTTVGTSWWTG